MKKLSNQYIASKLPKRPSTANKGTFGRVLVVAGSGNFPGAAYLACTAAYRIGAGLVTLATEREVKIIVSRKLPEVTFISPKEVVGKISEYDVLLVGPGLGQSNKVASNMERVLTKSLPMIVIDGDALNILSKMEKWWERIKGEAILTPHPGEMARLTGLTIGKIQSNREETALTYAKKWKQTLVLKGANTVVVSPAGEVKISPFVNPALATAGTGDVLAGVISGLVAQGLSPFDASCAGVYLHGLAGEYAKEKNGDAGVTANDLLPLLPKTIKQLSSILI